MSKSAGYTILGYIVVGVEVPFDSSFVISRTNFRGMCSGWTIDKTVPKYSLGNSFGSLFYHSKGINMTVHLCS